MATLEIVTALQFQHHDCNVAPIHRAATAVVIGQLNIVRPMNWRTFDYPFIYGKIGPSLFPVNNWREASRMALRRDAIERWPDDSVDDDEPLVEQILTNVLPRRGVWANSDEVLITIGAQNGLYLIAQLLMNTDTMVGIEDPCYEDARNMFSILGSRLVPLPVGKQGICVDKRLNDCQVLYVTSSHLPANNQRTVAHFLAFGHYDANQLRIATTLKRRWRAMESALSALERLRAKTPTFGGSSFWVELPAHAQARELEKRALGEGIIISAGDTWFADVGSHTNYCRFGFSSIEELRITPGINRLAA